MAIDDSNGSRAAIRFLSVSEIACDSRVSLLHVLPGAAVAEAGSSDDRTLDEASRNQKAQAESLLRDAVAMLDDRRSSERLVAHGDVAREIVKTVRSQDVDLVILGARGLRTLGRLLLGSVSETVLHQVSRPVIIVRE